MQYNLPQWDIEIFKSKMESFKDKLNKKTERLKFLRYLTGLSRVDVQAKYQIPQVSLKKWENGVLSLTTKAIIRCLEAYANEAVYTTVEWVEEGIGPIPSLSLKIQDNCDLDDDLQYFKEKYPDCVVHEIEENNLYPRYKKGEIVIGVVHKRPLEELMAKDCIFELINKKRGIAKVVIESKKINLISINSDLSHEKLLMQNVSVKFLAPIMWHQIK